MVEAQLPTTVASSLQVRSEGPSGESSLSNVGDGEPSPVDVVSRVRSVAKIVGLNAPVEAPDPVDGVWAGIPQSQHSMPVARDYCSERRGVQLARHPSLMLVVSGWLRPSMLLRLVWGKCLL